MADASEPVHGKEVAAPLAEVDPAASEQDPPAPVTVTAMLWGEPTPTAPEDAPTLALAATWAQVGLEPDMVGSTPALAASRAEVLKAICWEKMNPKSMIAPMMRISTGRTRANSTAAAP